MKSQMESEEEYITPLFASSSMEEIDDIEEEKEKTVSSDRDYDTLVISGGGVKCFILLGALQAFYDKHKLSKVNTYIGTSIGAVISFLLAIGYSPIELLISLQINKWLENLDSTFNVLNILNDVGVISWLKIQESLESLTINKIQYYPTLKNIYDTFKKRLVIVTYNFSKRITEYLDYTNYPDLPCLVALRMSCNIPLVFDKFKYMGSFYVDGGLGDNFAITKGVELTPQGNILGITLDKTDESREENDVSGVVDYVLALMQIPISASMKFRMSLVEKEERCKVIKINTKSYFDMSFVKFTISSKSKLDMFSLGYQQAKNNM